MTIRASGALSASEINTELGLSSTAQIGVGGAVPRGLAGVASGAIRLAADYYGKTGRVAVSYAFTTATASASLNVTTISGYSAGRSNITITVNSGVYLYGSSTGTPGLTISGGTAGDTVTLVNNGYILGRGGAGGNGGAGQPTVGSPGSAGGTALSVSRAVSITNNGTIAGGGGGGGGGGGFNTGDWYGGCGGGGGAPLGAGGTRGAWSGAGTGGASNGSTATTTTAGAGGPTINVSAAGGAGGAWGTAGGTGVTMRNNMFGGSGGAAGNYISGNSNVTWLTTGTRTGGVA